MPITFSGATPSLPSDDSTQVREANDFHVSPRGRLTIPCGQSALTIFGPRIASKFYPYELTISNVPAGIIMMCHLIADSRPARHISAKCHLARFRVDTGHRTPNGRISSHVTGSRRWFWAVAHVLTCSQASSTSLALTKDSASAMNFREYHYSFHGRLAFIHMRVAMIVEVVWLRQWACCRG